jgi:hypothetical protein
MATPKSPVLRFIEQNGIVRPSDLEGRGFRRSELYRLVREGAVARQGCGLYSVNQHLPPHSATLS